MTGEGASSSLHDMFPWMLVVAALSTFVQHFLEKNHISAFPESGVVMLVGVGFGCIGWLLGLVSLTAASGFNVEIFEYVFLPAIIFEGGYSLNIKAMYQNLRPILFYAFIGTAVSTFFVGFGLIYVLGPTGHSNLTDVESLMFGALLAAPDTVATLAIFSNVFNLEEADEANVPRLYHLIVGESVLNDAVAIVLYDTFSEFNEHPEVSAATAAEIIGRFFFIATTSILIGLAFGLLSALLTKWTRISHNHKFDLIFLYMCAFGSYYLCMLLKLSGLFAIFICGVVMGHYTWYNLSAMAQLSSPIFFKTVAALSETLIFCFLGTAVFAAPEVRTGWNLQFDCYMLILLTLGRAASVIPLSILANCGKKGKDRISWKEMAVVSYSSLRGSLSFALALKCLSMPTPNANVIVSSTLTLAMFTTMVQGSTLKPLLRCLGLQKKHVDATTPLILPYGGESDMDEEDHEEKEKKKKWWGKKIDKLAKPFFVANPEITGGTTKKKFRQLGRVLTSLVYERQAHDLKQVMLLDVLAKFSILDAEEQERRESGKGPLDLSVEYINERAKEEQEEEKRRQEEEQKKEEDEAASQRVRKSKSKSYSEGVDLSVSKKKTKKSRPKTTVGGSSPKPKKEGTGLLSPVGSGLESPSSGTGIGSPSSRVSFNIPQSDSGVTHSNGSDTHDSSSSGTGEK